MHMSINHKILSFTDGVHCLEQDGLIIYPTETFFAVGCKVHSDIGVHTLYNAKKRPQTRPIPVLAAHMDQVESIAKLNAWEEKLAQQFWPGPLTIVAYARSSIPSLVLAGGNKVALRISSHPVALALANASNDALVCSSANISGQTPVTDFNELSSELVIHTQGIVVDSPRPQGGLASTIVEVVRENCLRVRRLGAVSNQLLLNAGWEIEN